MMLCSKICGYTVALSVGKELIWLSPKSACSPLQNEAFCDRVQ